MMRVRTVCAPVLLCLSAAAAAAATTEEQLLWQGGKAQAALVAGKISGPMSDVVDRTLNGYLRSQFGWTLPRARRADRPGLYVVVGRPTDHPLLAELARKGVDLSTDGLGEEGFRIQTHRSDQRRFLIVTAATPVGLKDGCQELVFFHVPATASRASVDWPLEVKRRPQFAYRGIYMLPCWAQHDSVESWRRVLRFNSEITVNRNWFWLAGFPLLEKYGGEYAGTDLARAENVRSLVALCRAEGMKFYIGGGWYTWHHAKIADGSIDRGVQYYLDMVKLLPRAEGIYLEPAGEGRGADPKTWQERTRAFQRLVREIRRDRPDFEFAVAIGRFNDPRYRQAVHAVDAKRTYWWWCWGDPIRDGAPGEHPLILRWHTTVQMSQYHGSTRPPQPGEAALTGFATSYDPGMGYGNRWNGRGYGIGSGVDHAREFHPHTIPYFAHQYRFRERAWDVQITDERFAARLARRLFDADMPAEAIEHYLTLCRLCATPEDAGETVLAPVAAFVKAHARRGTPRNRDTLLRMQEAVDGLRKLRR